MQFFYAGTWKNQENPGKIIVLKKEDGKKARKIQEVVLEESVSRVEVDQRHRLLFAVLETREGKSGNCGGDLCVFQIFSDGSLKEVKRLPSYGVFPIDFAINESFVVIINHGSTTGYICRTRSGTEGIPEVYQEYDESSAVVFERDQSGLPERFLDLRKFEGHGIIPFFQNSAAPHSICYVKTGMYLIPERGTDQTTVFTIENKKLVRRMILCAPKGSGPRNAAVSRDGVDIYIITEIEPLLIHYRIKRNCFSESDKLLKKIEPIQILRTIQKKTAESLECNSQSFAAPHPSGIKMSEDETRLYVLTRSANTLSVYEREVINGSLTFIGEWKLSGENPRELHVKKDGLYITLLDSKKCVKITIDQKGIPVSEGEVFTDIPYLATVDIQ